MRTIAVSTLILALSLTACGVKEDTLHERLAPMERQTEELQNDQQALQQRLAASEAEMQRLRAELDALRPQPKGKKSLPPPKAGTGSGLVSPSGMAVPPPKILTPAQAAEEDRRRLTALTTPLTTAGTTPLTTAGTTPLTTAGTTPLIAAGTTPPATAGTTPLTTAGTPPHGAVPASITPPPLTSGTMAVTAQGATPRPPMPVASGTPPVKPEPRTPAASPSNEQSTYKAALATYEKGRFTEAEQQFDAYLQTWPSGKLAPNALYWKGECLYSKGRSADAVFVFKDVLTRFPKHPKAADALLKSIMTYRQLGDADNARLHFSVLQEDYPASPALKRAKELGLGR